MLTRNRGAVLSQLPHEAAVTSTQAVKHYGVSANSIYKESEDAGQPKLWDRYENTWRVTKMTWYINMVRRVRLQWPLRFIKSLTGTNFSQGEDLQRDQRVEFSFYRKLPRDFGPNDLIFVDELLECTEIEAVKYPADGVTKINCRMEADLRGVPRSEFEDRVSVDGIPYVTISYKLVITTKTAKMKFSMEIKGKELGKVDAVYE